MFKTYTFYGNKKQSLYPYFLNLSLNSTKFYNRALFFVRNAYSGINKEYLTENELEVLNIINSNLSKINALRLKKRKSKLINLKASGNSEKYEKEKKSRFHYFKFDKSNAYLGYNFLDGLFKFTNDSLYRNLPVHTAQRILKVLDQNYKGFFSALKDYNKNPSKYSGRPKMPYYKDKDCLSTLYFSNISCIIKDGYLQFPGTKDKYFIGKIENQIKTLVKTEVKVTLDGFSILLTFDDLKEYTTPESNDRYLGIDEGVVNFVTISNNIGLSPIIVKNDIIKGLNQYTNKKIAELQSCFVAKDKRLIKKNEYATKKTRTLNKYRSNVFRHYFYALANRIIDYCKCQEIKTICYGHNKKIKTNVNLGKNNNQTFVLIPFAQFRQILNLKCMENGIVFVSTEESYTSKASFLDNDMIPTYTKSDSKEINENTENNTKDSVSTESKKYVFSGKRTHRGLYKAADGTLINADVNGSCNIIRKAVGEVFSSLPCTDYLLNPVKINLSQTIHKCTSGCFLKVTDYGSGVCVSQV